VTVRIPQPPVALLMDFDGVILDSMKIKTQAFLTVYERESPSRLAQVLAYQRLHGGVTRRAKFAHFEQAIFGRPADGDAIERLAAAYRELIYEAVVACPFVRGAEDFLELAQDRIALHVISGTPRDELLEIIERRGLSSYFHSIAGAPTTKRDAFETILKENQLIAGETTAIGDATTEYWAADELGIPFIGVVPDGEPNPFPTNVPAIRSLEQLPALLGIR
jgi:phosphoglycolate phosphatase-like HAD superfamily hydrolase